MGAGRPPPPAKGIGNFYVAHRGGFRIDDRNDLLGLQGWILREGPGLIVVDSLAAACEGRLDTTQSAQTVLKGLAEVCKKLGTAALVLHGARVRRGLARAVADHPQLAATASLNLVLNQRPHLGGRLVTLALQGRGPWANRQLELLSGGPCDYKGHPLSSPRREILENRETPSGDERGSGGEQ